MEENNGIFDKIREQNVLFNISLQPIEEESESIKKMLEDNKKMVQENKKMLEENKKMLEENKKMLEENKKMVQENKKMLEKNKKMVQENERILEGLINNEIIFSINERLFDFFQENLNNDEILKKLEEIELNEQFKNKEENKCGICLEIFSIGDKVSYLPCFHSFHSSCIKNWIRVKNKCPFCNNIILF